MTTRTLRPAASTDAAGCLRIYAPFVTDTVVTLEEEVPSEAEFADRIERAATTHAWIVAEGADGRILGYAYAGPLKERASYRWSCEVSVYVDPAAHGTGLGRELYADLVRRLAERGFRRLVAVITLPNPASVGLHERFGFTGGPVLERIGYKHGRWVDVAWMRADLADPDDPGGDPLAPPPGADPAP